MRVFLSRQRPKLRETWDGYRQGPAGAVQNFGADDAFPIDDIDEILPGMLEGRERVYYGIGKDAEFDQPFNGMGQRACAAISAAVTPCRQGSLSISIIWSMRCG